MAQLNHKHAILGVLCTVTGATFSSQWRDYHQARKSFEVMSTVVLKEDPDAHLGKRLEISEKPTLLCKYTVPKPDAFSKDTDRWLYKLGDAFAVSDRELPDTCVAVRGHLEKFRDAMHPMVNIKNPPWHVVNIENYLDSAPSWK